MYYGNATVGDQWNIAGTWDENGASNYVGVWHLDEEASGTGTTDLYQDSSSYNNHGDDFVSATGQTGQIDGGQQFDGSNDYVDVPTSASLDITGDQITIEAWVRFASTFDSTATQDQTLIDGGGKIEYWFDEGNGKLWFALNTGGWSNIQSNQSSWTGGTWYHIVSVYNGANRYIYVNGSQDISGADTGTLFSNTFGIHISNPAPAANEGPFSGNIDEVRISNIARSLDWTATEFNNQSSPSTFYILGGQETPSITPAGRSMNTMVGSGAATMTFDTVGQTAYWYTDLTYPTGSDDATIAAGNYTLNMHFNGTPTDTVQITVAVHHTASDGSGETSIVSNSVNIDSATANPYVFDLGSGAEQTFSSSDPRRLRVRIRVNAVSGGGTFTLAYDSSTQDTNLNTPAVTVPEIGIFLLVLVPLIPYMMSVIWRRKRLAGQLISLLLAISIGLGWLAADVPTVVAAPDIYYLHNTPTTGISPAGEYKNTTQGTGGATMSFSTVDQNAYWYTDVTYPIGNDNGGIANGDYTLNMYFDQLPGLLAKTSTFNSPVGTGNQSVSGVGFQPKAVLFWITNRNSPGASPGALFGRGWTDGANQAAAATIWQDGSDTTAGRQVNDKSILLVNVDGTVRTDAAIVSLDADGFTLNWTTAGGNRLVSYLALGGAALTNVKVGSQLLSVSNATESITGVGFQPDSILLFGARGTAFGATQEGHAFGVAASTTSRHSSAHRERDTTGNGTSGYRDNRALVGADDTTTPEAEWDIQSFDADGFTLSGSPSENMVMSYLALKGISVAEGILTQPTSTGNQSVTGLSFQPSVVLFDGGDKTTVSGFENEPEMVHGVATSSTERSAIWIGRNSTAADTSFSTSTVIRSAIAGPPSLNASADFVSMNSDGFTINWSADASQERIGWVALGPGNANVQISASVWHTASDGSGASSIVSSATTTIDAATANPLALSVGNDPTGQTFTSADPRRLMVRITVSAVNAGGSFVLAYDSASQDTNLTTPTVTVPEGVMGLAAGAIVIPALAATAWRRRRTKPKRGPPNDEGRL